jgi:hypothetical protein
VRLVVLVAAMLCLDFDVLLSTPLIKLVSTYIFLASSAFASCDRILANKQF